MLEQKKGMGERTERGGVGRGVRRIEGPVGVLKGVEACV